MLRAVEVVDQVAPNAKPEYRQAFDEGDGLLAAAGINTPLRLAHFLAQACHETGGLRILIESGRYSAKNLGQMWDGGNWHKYFVNRAACVAMADKCVVDGGVALFSLVYGGRMGNGKAATKDGWTYRGRGIMQTTGRDNYKRYGKSCKVGFEDDPDLIIAPEHALKPALAEWTEGNLNVAADHDDIEVITKRINGGLIGLDERKAWLARIKPLVIGAMPVEHSIEWKVQEKLHERGYRKVSPDGVIGPNSRAAIIDFRARHGLKPGNGISDDLLTELGVS